MQMDDRNNAATGIRSKNCTADKLKRLSFETLLFSMQ